MTIEASGPNAEQIKYWNEVSGPKWVALHDFIDPQIAPLGRMAMERAQLSAGERVLDVGCGCGATTMDLASRVAPGGRAVGLDISAVMLQRAQQTAQSRTIDNVEFINADAQTTVLPQQFDLIFSRFGVMFFQDPPLAFRNLRAALAPGGRLTFVCWQSLLQNEWMVIPVMAAAQHIPLPPPPAPDAPGPFAFADPDRVRGILTAAGFESVDLEGVQTQLNVGGGYDLDQIVDFLLQMGPTAQAIREAGQGKETEIKSAIRDALLPYQTDEGLRMGATVWIVSAR